MTTLQELEQRVTVLENRMAGVATDQAMREMEERLNSKIYTVEGRLGLQIDQAKKEVLDAIASK